MEGRNAEWRARPAISALVRVVVVVFPVVLSVLGTYLATRLVPRPRSGWELADWWVALTGFATAVAVYSERLARRALPLSALFRLTLVFPDYAPRRFSVALRTGTSKQLARRIEAAQREGLGDTPHEAAAHLIELVAALNAHDRLTRGHCERVRAYTDLLAKELKLSKEDTSRLHWAGMIHDIGKLEVPAHILNKPDALTDAEYEIIKRHPQAGARLAAPLAEWLGEWGDAIAQHHERWDGSGYPYGLAGNEISFGGRIVAVADVFDVITAARSYKKPRSAVEARAELARCAGTQFDPAVVRAFLNLSLGRLRVLIGPLSWLADLPVIGRIPLAPVGGALSAAASVGVLLFGAVLGGAPHHHADVAGLVETRRDVAVAAVAPTPPTTTPFVLVARPVPADSSQFLPPTPAPRAIVTIPPPQPVLVLPVSQPDSARAPTPPPPVVSPPPSPPPVVPVPVLTADAATTPEAVPVLLDVLANDAGGFGAIDPTTLIVAVSPTVGSATVTAGHAIIFQTPAGFTGADAFTYQVCDVAGGCAVAGASVDVQPVAVAVADSASLPQGASVSIDVAGNDTGGLGTLDPTSVTLAVAPLHGLAFANGDGTVTYVPAGGYVGPDTLGYDICDVGGACASATVTITVLPVPVLAADVASTTSDQLAVIDVLANDSGGLGTLDPTSLAVVGGPSAGTATVNPDHTITYTPSSGFAGTDLLTYEACDAAGACALASVTVVVDPPTLPVLVPDSAAVGALGGPIDVLANDSGGAGTLDPSTLVVVSAPTQGTTTVNPDHTITYTPAGAIVGSDTFRYRVCDLAAGCATTSVTVTVLPLPAPVVANDAAVTNESTAVTIDVLANDGGGLGVLAPSSLGLTSPPASGTVSISGGRVVYAPNFGFAGGDSFGYQVCDVAASCSNGSVAVTVINRAPTATADTAITVKNQVVVINVLANDSDPGSDIDPATLAVTVAPGIGSAVVNLDRTITFNPNHDKRGTDSFTYQVCDLHGLCSSAVVTVTVLDSNKAPAVTKDAATTTVGTPVVINVLVNDSDIDDPIAPASLTVSKAASNGVAVANPDGTITYTPNAGFTGIDSFKYSVCDSLGACSQADVNVTVS